MSQKSGIRAIFWRIDSVISIVISYKSENKKGFIDEKDNVGAIYSSVHGYASGLDCKVGYIGFRLSCSVKEAVK